MTCSRDSRILYPVDWAGWMDLSSPVRSLCSWKVMGFGKSDSTSAMVGLPVLVCAPLPQHGFLLPSAAKRNKPNCTSRWRLASTPEAPTTTTTTTKSCPPNIQNITKSSTKFLLLLSHTNKQVLGHAVFHNRFFRSSALDETLSHLINCERHAKGH